MGRGGEHEGRHYRHSDLRRVLAKRTFDAISGLYSFLTADVSVTPNLNEIRDYKYVSKAELQAMFEDPGTSPGFLSVDVTGILMILFSQFVYTLVQIDRSRLSVWMVGYALATKGRKWPCRRT